MNNTFDDWQPTLLTEQAPVPTQLAASNATLTWADNDYTLLWAVCKDGKVIAFTTQPTFTATESGTYAVRAANEMGGLSAASESVTISDQMISSIKSQTSVLRSATKGDACLSKKSQTNFIYDLQGRRVNENSSHFTLHSSLKKGLYIVGGRTVFVK
jgi:hypothetical protein